MVSQRNLSTSAAISEDKSAEFDDYEDTQPSKNGSVIRISSLPSQIRASAMMVDSDNDGALNHGDMKLALHHLDSREKENRNLKVIIVGFCFLTVLLVACIFGASVAAVRLSQEVSINPSNGFAYVKGTEETEIMKTEEAIVWTTGGVLELSIDELNKLTELIMADGDVRFKVKGSARDVSTDTVIVLVEGGTITFGAEGLNDASGYAKTLLESVLGEGAFEYASGDDERRRSLLGGCTYGAGWSF